MSMTLNSLLALTISCIAACDLYLPLIAPADLVPPYPPSPVISHLDWADKKTIRRAASGSDNWPVTWAADGDLYVAYGDGWGFEPKVESKLSLGFAKVSGDPGNFAGFNIRSAAEQEGQGRLGKKASGLLMIDDVLYMWVRNVTKQGEGCQLAWSEDLAVSWTWTSWTFSEFGYCTFVNFGRNYEDAIDDYVYMVTPDFPSAYDPGDDFVLTRVPKDEILSLESYEYFVSLDNKSARWTDNINERGSVFSHPGRSRRSGISYNSGLERFIWWQGIPHEELDEKRAGAIGIYDAPMPWGPWTTVYFSKMWDVGPGETASFPPKWMSANGKTMYLLFSGDDAFSVRKATLTVASSD